MYDGKLNTMGIRIRQRLAHNGDLPMGELCMELAGRAVAVHRSNVCRLIHRLG
ncbi:hypothetical protein [Sinorhizobium arboris]|uniref:hypothetical protein n=1 Tax=Sinorhizobium arboris TaxID=76745 RepID=UPI00041FAC27|nr:hypothetical protein [Sinorhizobium arboris]